MWIALEEREVNLVRQANMDRIQITIGGMGSRVTVSHCEINTHVVSLTPFKVDFYRRPSLEHPAVATSNREHRIQW